MEGTFAMTIPLSSPQKSRRGGSKEISAIISNFHSPKANPTLTSSVRAANCTLLHKATGRGLIRHFAVCLVITASPMTPHLRVPFRFSLEVTTGKQTVTTAWNQVSHSTANSPAQHVRAACCTTVYSRADSLTNINVPILSYKGTHHTYKDVKY